MELKSEGYVTPQSTVEFVHEIYEELLKELRMKHEFADLYEYLASALVNNDTSSIDDDEEAMAEYQETLVYLERFEVVDVLNGTFYGRPETHGLPGELATYVLRRR